MDAEQIIAGLVPVAALAGFATGMGMTWWLGIRPLQKHLRAAHDSQADVVSLWKRERKHLRGEVAMLGERLESAQGESETHAMVADLAIAGAEFQARKRRATQASLELVLGFYGRAVERADAAETELFRERLVSAGLEALVGGERAA